MATNPEGSTMMRITQVVVLIFIIMALVSSNTPGDPMEPLYRMCDSKYKGAVGRIGCKILTPHAIENYQKKGGKRLIVEHRCCLFCTRETMIRRICFTTKVLQDFTRPYNYSFEFKYTHESIAD